MTSSKDSAKASMPPASSAVRDVRQEDVAEGLEAVGAEVHRGLDQRRRQCGGSARRRCCRRRRCRRSRGRARWSRTRRGCRARSKAERSAMPVTMPGSAIGRTSSSEIASRPKKRARDSAAAASVPSTSASAVDASGDPDRQPRAPPRCRRASQATREPVQREAGRRELVAAVLGGEGVEQDERRAAGAGTARPAAAASFSPRTAPCQSPRSERIERSQALGDGRGRRP